MSIDTIFPADTAILAHGDSFAFTVDDTYTSMVVQAVTAKSTESVYDSANGGAQSGYVVSVTSSGGRDTFTVDRTAGWNISPQIIYVTEDETGTSAQTSFSYSLTSEFDYPQSQFPYDPIQLGSLIVSEEEVLKERRTTAMDFNGTHFNVTGLGNGKADVDTNITTYPMEIIQDGVSLSAHAESITFNDSVRGTEDTPNNFSLFNRARNHSLTSHGSETVDLLFQGDGDATDDTGNHTFTTASNARYGAGAVPGTQCGHNGHLNGTPFYTATGTAFRKSPGDAFSVYGMFNFNEPGATQTPFLFYSGQAGTSADYSLFLDANRYLLYKDQNNTFSSGFLFPTDTWTHVGLTRDASNVVKIYLNGSLIATSGALTPPALDGSYFAIGGINFASNNYWRGGGHQSIKIVAAELTAAAMLSEYRRMSGR